MTANRKSSRQKMGSTSIGLFRRLRGPLAGAAAISLVFMTATALGGSGVGGVFNLGQTNTVDAQSQLIGNVGGNPELRVENAATSANSFGILGKLSSSSATSDSAGVRGENDSSGIGVAGESNDGFGGAFKSFSGNALLATTHGLDKDAIVGTSDNGSGAGVFGSNENGIGGRFVGLTTGALGSVSGRGSTGVSGSSSGAAGRGVKGTASASGGVGVEGIASSDSNSIGVHGVSTTGLAGKFDGNVKIQGSVTASANIAKTYSGVAGSAIPVAYGVIRSDGVRLSGTANVTSVFDSTNKQYVITIAGASYTTTGFITVVTPLSGSAPLIASTSALAGKLVVRLTDAGNQAQQAQFSFLTYKP